MNLNKKVFRLKNKLVFTPCLYEGWKIITKYIDHIYIHIAYISSHNFPIELKQRTCERIDSKFMLIKLIVAY